MFEHPFMQTTPGMTEPNLTELPIGTEGEMTPGPDDINPFNSAREARLIEEIEAEQRRGRTGRPDGEQLEETIGADDVQGMDAPDPTPPAFDGGLFEPPEPRVDDGFFF